jgi:NADPH-dependent glutamate synthase beta subunit-like oxidoreductase
LVREANPMAAVCGAVCPAEIFCQAKCTRARIDSPLRIRELHAWATSFERPLSAYDKPEGVKIAIIGAGPAGLSCASELCRLGINAVVFEARENAGGVSGHSIPDFRLPDAIVNNDINYACNLGAEIIAGAWIEMPSSLLGEYPAVFVSTGLPRAKKLGIPDEDIPGITPALFFLEEARAGRIPSLAGRRVIVVGGGNVSLDVASAADQLGACEVRLLYRRGPNEMKVWKSELEEAARRGVVIDFLVSPKRFISENDTLSAIECVRTELGDEVDTDGRRIPREIPGNEFIVPADLAVVAVGMTSEYLKDVTINPDMTTSMPGLFVGGDLRRGEGTVVEAVADGKRAARVIAEYVGRIRK